METIYASKGLKKMFIAQIGGTVCIVLAVLPLINIVAVIAALAFSILSIVGLYEAGRNIDGCKTAFMLTIANMALSVWHCRYRCHWTPSFHWRNGTAVPGDIFCVHFCGRDPAQDRL